MNAAAVEAAVCRTLAATLACAPAALDQPGLAVVEWHDLPERLRHPVPDRPLLVLAGLAGAVVSCTADRRAWVQEHLAPLSPNQLMGAAAIAALRDLVARDGQVLYGPSLASVAAPEWLAEPSIPEGVELRQVGDAAVSEMYAYPGFANALGYTQDDPRPDVVATAALVDGRPVGMAGASADSDALWQVGVDVVQAWQGRGLGVYLVAAVSRQVLAHGRVPFYTTSVANVRSQRLAARAGYRPRWTSVSAQDPR